MRQLQGEYYFKLRHNIALDGDLALAKLELDAFFPAGVEELLELAPVLAGQPGLGENDWASIGKLVRSSGSQGFRGRGPLALLPDLIAQLAFVQRIYLLVPAGEQLQDWLAQLVQRIGPVVVTRPAGESQLIEAVPHYALFEYAEVAARQASDRSQVHSILDDLLAVLLDGQAPCVTSRAGRRAAEKALAARATTALLAHDIHYYKAKFFPRLARSMLNVAGRQLGTGTPRVLDPFVGSGTTLLEAALLGMPAVGLDLDPLSVLISRTKLGVGELDGGLVAAEVERIKDRLADPARKPAGSVTFPGWLLKNRKMTPALANMLSDEITTLQWAIAGCDPAVRPLAQVLMSDAISRRIKMRFLGTGVGRFSLTLAKTPATQLLLRSLQRYVKTIAVYDWLRQTIRLACAPAEVIEGDARCLPDGLGTFDLVLTSPPYLPASSGRESYAKARAPSLIALGIKDPQQVDSLVDGSIGSMDGQLDETAALTVAEQQLVSWLQADPLRSIKATPTARYFLDMRRSFDQLATALRPGGIAVVVSGKQSTFYHFQSRQPLYVVPAAELLAEEAMQAGLLVEGLLDVQLQKSNRNARPRSLDDYYETLIRLRRPG